MVKGLDTFREFFKDYTHCYILSGGTACDEQLAKAGVVFRATKDLDIVLIVEALDHLFIDHFWSFIRDGRYGTRQKSSGERKYYRFKEPKNEVFPEQLELFTRNPDLLDLAEHTHLTPIPVDADLSSLSAILMNDDYYHFTIDTSEIVSGLHYALPTTLICLKAKAYLELSYRKQLGDKVNSRDIKKHRNDIFRMATILANRDKVVLPETIAKDMTSFLSDFEAYRPDLRSVLKNMGMGNLRSEDLIEQINSTFNL